MVLCMSLGRGCIFFFWSLAVAHSCIPKESSSASAGKLTWEQNRRDNFLVEQIAPFLQGFPLRRGKRKK